jgi:8-oxo-dGTP pyrophosphatase MutT (NUDIX family)
MGIGDSFDIKKAAGILIKNRKILVEKSIGKDFFIAPGGKPNPGETMSQCLVRELSEEFNISVHESDLEVFDTYCAPAAGQEGKVVCMEVFRVKKWTGTPVAFNRTEKIRWINSKIPKNLQVGSIFSHEVIPRLKSENLID